MQILEARPKKNWGRQAAVQEHDFNFISRGAIPGQWYAVFQEGQFVGHAIINRTAKHLGYFIKTSLEQGMADSPRQTFATPELALAVDEEAWVKNYIQTKLSAALAYRQRLADFTVGRLCYGIEDGLPGLIIDLYQNCVIYQINLAGIDRFRREVHTWLAAQFPEHQIFNLENPAYRQSEGLCSYQEHPVTGVIKFTENGLHYAMEASVLQKMGHYFDHARNRQRCAEVIKQLARQEHLISGLDLFCYGGSWGLNLLKAGVEHFDFVDQGNFAQTIEQHLAINGLAGRGTFFREDVFRFLAAPPRQKYQVVVCDPPAFSKGAQKSPIGGYRKLYRALLPHLAERALVVVASCTHGIGLAELDQVIQQAWPNQRMALLDLGGHNFDHPISSLSSASYYLKYLLYLVENPGI